MSSHAILTCPQCGRVFEAPAERCTVDGAPLYGPEVMARVGEELNNYKIHGILGEGGMGVVYRGEHIMLGKPVAIKILHDRFARREGAATHFLREARAASRIRHPNIVDVTDFGKAPDGSIFFVMEYLEGESLEDVLARDVRVPLFDAVNIVNQIARGLAAAHEHKIIHQDLKPDNVYLIDREGRRRIVRRLNRPSGESFVVEHEGRFGFVKLLDFGVAKFNEPDNLGPGLTAKTGMVFGTPHYMSPEQAQGLAVDHRSDIYALGILFYEMITGQVPFDSESALDILNAHVSSPVPTLQGRDPRVSVDDTTNATVLRCLEKDPDDRFQSMDELCVALRNCFTDRVFLRDANRLPGAAEAGITPPDKPPPEQAPAVTPAASSPTPPAGPPASSPTPPAGPPTRPGKKRLTDELSELFGAAANASAEPDAPGVAATAAEAVPLQPRGGRGTKPVTPAPATPEPSPAASPPSKRSNKRRATEPLVSKAPSEERSKTHTGIGAVRPDGARKRRGTAPFGTDPKGE